MRLKCIQQEVELKYADPIHTNFVDDEDDPMIGWLVGQQEEPVLDEPGSPPRPASFVATEAEVDAGRWADRNIPRMVPSDQPQPQGSLGSQSSYDSLSETSSQRYDRELRRRGQRATRSTRSEGHYPSSQHRQPEKGRKGKQAVAAPLERVEEESVHSDSETRSSSDDSSGDHGSSSQGGSGGCETTVYETQPQGGARFTGESQFTHATQDRDHGGRSGRASGSTIAYRRRAPRGHSGHDAAADDLVRGVGSIDVSGSESYTGSYYPPPQAAYDPYGYGYGYGYSSSEASSGSYYPTQPGTSYGSDLAGNIFGWAPQSYYGSEDTSQSQSFSERSERSESAYNPERIPYGMNLQEYNAAWIEGWTDVPPDYVDDPDIYERHRHSTRF